MFQQKLLFLAAICGCAIALLAVPTSAKTKAHKQIKASHGRLNTTYLVPPPPAYMPSILPELKTAENTESVEPAKPVNPYKKYVYTKEGHEGPPPVQPNKYVTYWNKKS
jgi:hypothetical protein